MDEARATRVANQAAILNTQTPKLNTVTPVSMSGTGTTTTSLPENVTLSKQGGWLTKYKEGGETEPKLEQYKFYRNEFSTPAGYGVIHEGFYPSYTIGDRTGITYDFDSSSRWGRNIYTSPNGNDTIYFTTSDPYEYIDNVSGSFVMVGTPHVSQKAAKKGWFEQLFGLRAPIVVEEESKEAFNRAKKE